jgi:hypothetical protein
MQTTRHDDERDDAGKTIESNAAQRREEEQAAKASRERTYVGELRNVMRRSR